MTRFFALALTVGLRLIFLDEFHDCANTDGKGKPFLRCIKSLINAGFLVVPVGTDDLAAVLLKDRQLSSRFDFKAGELHRLDKTEQLGDIKKLMEIVIGLPELEIKDEAVQYVQMETRGIFGDILNLTERAFVKFKNLDLNSLTEIRKKMTL